MAEELNEEAQQEVTDTKAEVETLEDETAEVQDTTDWKAKYEETTGRLKRAETKLDKLKIEKKVVQEVEKIRSTGDLDETQLDYLDLKGVTEDEDIEVIESIVKKTGQTVRQALKDDYVISKLTANKAKRDVQNATPGSTKRAGGQTGDIASAVAKFKETGVLPTDLALADAVVDAVAKVGNDRLPPWQR